MIELMRKRVLTHAGEVEISVSAFRDRWGMQYEYRAEFRGLRATVRTTESALCGLSDYLVGEIEATLMKDLSRGAFKVIG
ncbi:hypothetical protein [Bordetella bronchiseptica]|uniref:hypothetical protein n=1 Tax=Bordetella bronchiseptica TaxID=518 RepID=UPI0004620841|nr:hypothetical protein [Bordetella bronchiseptica]KDD18714.1 hypothetical protein L522_4176 [Bordetella bronchiseptica MBORD707]